MHQDLIAIDGLQYSNWSRQIFEQFRRGGLSAVHVTIAYWENARETLSNIGRWNQHYEQHGDLIMPVHTVADIHEAKRLNKTGIIYGFQNCSPIEDDIALIEVFQQLGVKLMQLSYNNQSLLATGCYEEHDPGVTRFGKAAIREMNRVGMIVDMSHSAERSTLEAIELSARPIVISHANPTSFHPALRNKSDTVLKALSESGGLLGFSAYPFHLKNGPDCTLDQFCDMVARTADLMGVEHLGIGTDLCLDQPTSVLTWMRNGRWSKQMDYGEGSAGNSDWPRALDWFKDSGDFPTITRGLRERGFADSDVARIMGGNWLELFEKSF
jgi:microsomal dipeptidase-like Zn-dependent dipeptidase